MSADDARALIGSPMASSLAFREANTNLLVTIGRMPAQSRGIRLSDLLQAIEDQRPRHPNDKGGIANDALRALGRPR